MQERTKSTVPLLTLDVRLSVARLKGETEGPLRQCEVLVATQRFMAPLLCGRRGQGRRSSPSLPNPDA